MQLAPVMMNFRYGGAFGMAVPEAYETLLLDAMLGDPTLFARHDFVHDGLGFDVAEMLAAHQLGYCFADHICLSACSWKEKTSRPEGTRGSRGATLIRKDMSSLPLIPL